MAKSPEERIRDAAASDRIRAELSDLLTEGLQLDDLRELAEAATQLAEAIEGARDDIEAWEFSEDRDERAGARDTAAESLEGVVSALDDLQNWTDWPRAESDE